MRTVRRIAGRLRHRRHHEREELLASVRDFYFKIWHDAGMMHLFTVESVDPEHRSVLDVGCGTGLNAPLILSQNPDCHYTGIDANEFAIEVAERSQLPNCRFIVGDFESLAFEPASIDVVVCNSVLEHKADYRPLVRRLTDTAASLVVLGFYRGLRSAMTDDIAPVPTDSFWEPKYGYGTRQWPLSYLNTYSEPAFRTWVNDELPGWDLELIDLHNPVLREFPHATMARLKRG